jgi:hypothetical protein
VAAEILASRQEVKMEDEEEEDEKKPFIDIVLEETEVGPWIRIRIRIRINLNCWIQIRIREGKNDPQK